MNKNIKVIFFFIISYIISQILVKLLSKSNFLKSPMYILLPIVGFFMMYYLTPTLMNFINLKNKYYFLILVLFFGLVSFYIAVYFFFWNTQGILSHSSIKFNYIKLLLDSAFLEFIISCGFGIVSTK